MVTPAARREAVIWFRDRYGLSERRACGLAGMSRSSCRYQRQRGPSEQALRRRLEEVAAERPRFGYRRLHAVLVREGWKVNRKRVYRLYRALGLAVQRKRRKQVAAANRRPRMVPLTANEQWSADFMRDSLADGRAFRTLNIVDDTTRECPAIEVDTSLPGERVVRVLDRVAAERGYPSRLVIDNGPEFTGKALDRWAYDHGVALIFIRPGKPIENCLVESFNGRFRDECLNLHWFTHLGQARQVIERWRLDYNHHRPHSALGYQPPVEYARAAGLRPTPSSSAPPPPAQLGTEEALTC